jgi:signal transduction histidine kinase
MTGTCSSRTWRRGEPDTTVGQLLSIVLGGLLLTLAIVLCLLVWLHPDDTAVLRGPRSDALQIASLIDAMRALPGPARPGVAAAIRTPGLRIRLGDASPLCSNAGSSDTWAQALSVALRRLLPSDPAISVHHCHVSAGGDIMEVRAADLGAIFDIEVGIKIDPGMVLHIWLPLISAMLFVFFLVAVLSVWAVLRIIQPLQRLSTTVERFGREVEVAPLTEEGPREIRRAARAFNQMQERIAGAVRDRTRMLAAISHDLRTPITRMRLRVELEHSGDYRVKTMRDLDLMQRMISSALDFLRGAQVDDPVETVELGSLLQTLCDEAGESGADVVYAGEDTIFCRCRPNALSRAVTNLVENACRYGRHARVEARQMGDEVFIDVLDEGPGIPDPLKLEALQPFSRLDPARAMGDGVGLGLAIVADIARHHGGRLALLNRAGGGLLARIVLPCPQPASLEAAA